MAGLGLFVLADERARAPRPARSDSAPPVEAQALQAPAEAPEAGPVSFLVRFDADHPLAEAQTMAANGDLDAAGRLAERLIRRQRALRGLCFDRFTLGGAEIVLKACQSVPVGDPDAFARGWRERFETMPGVTYAEPNQILRPEGSETARP